MRYALNVPNFGAFADVRALAELAHEAEEAGWDGFFLWDHIGGWPAPTADPWVALAAMAMTTSRIRLGPLVTPLPRQASLEAGARDGDARPSLERAAGSRCGHRRRHDWPRV